MAPEPTKSTKRAYATALALAGLALLALWHFGGLQSGNRLISAVHSAAHFPIFGALAAVVFALLRLYGGNAIGHGKGTYIGTFFVMVALSLAAEGLQTRLPHRDGSMRDVVVNLLGTVAALSLLRWRDLAPKARGRRLFASIAVIATLIIAFPLGILGAAYAKRALDFPILLRFNTVLDQLHVRPADAYLRRQALPAGLRRDGDPQALCVMLGAVRYPGLVIPDPIPNWMGFEALELEIINPGASPLRLSIRIDDQDHDGRREDRYNGRLELPPRSRIQARIPLVEISAAPGNRPLRLEAIDRVLLFARAEDQGKQFCIVQIKLFPEDSR